MIEHEESWIPAEFREAMDEATQGKWSILERLTADRDRVPHYLAAGTMKDRYGFTCYR